MTARKLFGGLLALGAVMAACLSVPGDASSQATKGEPKVKAIHAEVTVPAPVADVYSAWTSSKGTATFFSPHTRIDPRVGGAFEIYFNTAQEPGLMGSEGCRILAIEPNKRLSFTWNAPPQFLEIRKQRTMVMLDFREEGAGKTRVALDHVGWGEGGEWDKVYEYFGKAWPSVLDNLKKRFESGPIRWTETKPPSRQAQFIYFIHPAREGFIEKSTPEEQKAVGEHFAYLQKAVADGKVVLAGRALEAPWTGLVIFTAKDKAEADAFTNADPAVKAGVFKAVFHPFALALLQ